MKIEKINENSISLTMQDNELKARNLNLSDLSYGSEKAKKLLVELMQVADTEVGFKADAPLAVEAVPLADGGIKLVVSKVYNPDELDARYSRFTPTKNEKLPLSIMQAIASTFDRFEEALKNDQIKGIEDVNGINKLEIRKEEELVSIFEFENIDKASDACKNVNNFDYESVFYKDEKSKKFYLVLNIKGTAEKEKLLDFNKVSNAIAEYGVRVQGGLGMNQAYYEEHYKIIIKEDAVKKLGML